jgi:hypothetical protein
MRIAFLHYHLKTGGVTTVLRQQVAAINGVCEAVLVTGDRAGSVWPCKVVEIPEIGYDRPGQPAAGPQKTAEKMLTALGGARPGGCDVLHVHNPTLAKNRHFMRILKRLQQSGLRLFLQIHDFAEDGRPGAYFREPYPEDCHYGVINSRDRDILLAAGLDASGLHLLPNAVDPLPRDPGRPAGSSVLYAIRAIRRKNIGEAILLSLFLKDNAHLAVSQPPNSPPDIASYQAWRRFVREKGLRVQFEVGRRRGFSACVGTAASMVTTSIAEGFGLSFLEPWTAGKLLWGRRLGDICKDFEQNGIRLDTLYDRLAVPCDWLDADVFASRWRAAVATAADAFDYPPAAAVAERGPDLPRQGEPIDFGLLDEFLQRSVLSRLLADGAARVELVALNPWLAAPGTVPDAAAVIAQNRAAVRENYGPSRYRERLLSVYDRVVGTSVRHCIDKRAVFEAFFDPAQLPLLKWGAYDG